MSVGPPLVIDTNVLVSAGLWPKSVPGQLLTWAMTSGPRWAICDESIAELTDVLHRNKFVPKAPLAKREEFIDFIRLRGKHFTLDSAQLAVARGECRDPDDERYLALALSAQATTIVSGDADLLAIGAWRGVAIRTPADYLKQVT